MRKNPDATFQHWINSQKINRLNQIKKISELLEIWELLIFSKVKYPEI